MSSLSRKADWPIIAGVILVLVVVTLSGYVGAYLLLTKEIIAPEIDPIAPGMSMVRYYDSVWKARLFKPAAFVESLLTQEHMMTDWSPYVRNEP